MNRPDARVLAPCDRLPCLPPEGARVWHGDECGVVVEHGLHGVLLVAWADGIVTHTPDELRALALDLSPAAPERVDVLPTVLRWLHPEAVGVDCDQHHRFGLRVNLWAVRNGCVLTLQRAPEFPWGDDDRVRALGSAWPDLTNLPADLHARAVVCAALTSTPTPDPR